VVDLVCSMACLAALPPLFCCVFVHSQLVSLCNLWSGGCGLRVEEGLRAEG